MTEERYEQQGGDWIGWLGQRRTMLKATKVAAMDDVRAGRLVCKDWPSCKHMTADQCKKATR